MGARTGRSVGFCTGAEMPGYANPLPGRGFGMGFGRGRGVWSRGFGGGGRGWRNVFCATGLPGWARFDGFADPYVKPDPEMEKQVLKSQAEAMQKGLEEIKERLSEIEADTASSK
ncbi:MAG: DUF5320 domain-containing protein [Acidobacteriota bacterium]|nr:DUF5320 domain-containing protein [Acidobacteriota bacterium]